MGLDTAALREADTSTPTLFGFAELTGQAHEHRPQAARRHRAIADTRDASAPRGLSAVGHLAAKWIAAVRWMQGRPGGSVWCLDGVARAPVACVYGE